MLKEIVAVVVGYLTMFVFIFVTFSAMYLIMGADNTFKPGVYDPSVAWIVGSIILGLIAAVLGGFVCVSMAKNSKTPSYLIGLVLVLGIASAIPVLMMDESAETKVRTGDVGNLEAMTDAKQPVWVALINPIIGAVGVLVGVRLRKKRK